MIAPNAEGNNVVIEVVAGLASSRFRAPPAEVRSLAKARVPLLACPAVQKTLLGKPAVAPRMDD